jgi:DNA repair protein SbcC/Rad50
MIPLKLRLSGFLSYRDPAELDFGLFDLACISGGNGAGKSSLLDAMTWVLFGQARKRDEALINNHPQVKAAEVSLTFEYEGGVYRVQRILPRGKTTLLEFHLRDGDEWRPLTERTLRETQARIEQVLRLDYETFVNAAFFLQGKADQFTQQSAGRRKEILGSILGLEVWETYRERTAERRKAVEREMDAADGRLQEIAEELDEEPARRERLAALEAELGRLGTARQAQEAALESVRRVSASLAEQQKLVEALAAQEQRSRKGLAELQERLALRLAEREGHAVLLGRAAQVEAGYQAWQAARQALEAWEQTAARFHEHQAKRQPLLTEIEAERARLEQERASLELQAGEVAGQESTMAALRQEVARVQESLAAAEARLAERAELDTAIRAGRERLAELKAENEGLRAEMEAVKGRIESLEVAAGAACPLCGQPLSEAHRRSTLEQLGQEGKARGDRFRANQAEMAELTDRLAGDERTAGDLAPAEGERLAASGTLSQLQERLERLQGQTKEWERGGAKRLQQVGRALAGDKFAPEARKKLASLDRQLAALGYEAAAHDAARRAEAEGRSAEAELRNLESARAALKPLDNEIAGLQAQIAGLQAELQVQQTEHATATASYEQARSQAPDLGSAERALYDLQEQENRLNQEVGAARQKVTVLDDLRLRKADLEARRQELALIAGRHRSLERAFGKDGVPALLIEQALPEIESQANELLDRLSNGGMSVRFVTQAEYKDRKREDLRETLDIQISDGAGAREYEMFSGGEAFRVNFAIRLALSRVLARRKGARLQTLVIDEGFGSQDAQGRQRLIEAINLAQVDFAKVLVITHMEELKDAFPTRIEVEKTERGSTLAVR